MSTEIPAQQTTGSELSGSTQELGDFLYRSFLFSQGNTTLHYCVLAYGRDFYSEQLASLTDPDHEEIRRIAAKKAAAWVQRGPHVDLGRRPRPHAVTDSVGATIDYFEGTFTHQQSSSDPQLDLLTSRQMILSDHKWLVEKGGRPNRKGKGGSKYNDPFLSHVIRYGLLGENTHNPALNHMFDRLKPVFRIRLAHPETDFDSELGYGFGPSEEINRRLATVFSVYMQHHPEDALRIEQAPH